MTPAVASSPRASRRDRLRRLALADSPRTARRDRLRRLDDALASSPRASRRDRLRRLGPAIVLLALAGCGEPPSGVRAEPASLVFTPANERLELRLVNHGDAPVPLRGFRLDPRSPNWGAFTFENREYPREIAAGEAVSLRLRVDRDHFKRPDASPGATRLVFAAGGAPQVVELHYQRPDLGRDLRLAGIRTALLLGLVGLAWALTRRARPTPTWTAWLPALTALALLPLGAGLCPGALGQSLSAADLDQCAAGRGGVPLSLVAVGEGWLVYLLALALCGLGRLRESSPLARRLASRDLALAGAFAGPLLAFGTLDPRSLVGEQAAGLLGGVAIPPAWGVLVQPIAAAVALAVAAGPPATRVERLGFAAAFVACFLGGFGLLALPQALGHGLAVLVGLAVVIAKIAAIAWLVQRLHATSGSRTRAALAGLERAAIPLVVANLLVTSAYAITR
jgi:hypothetical protein